MGEALIYLVVMVLVAAVIFLVASAVFGRGEELAPLPPGASPTRLPADEITPEDIRHLRFQQTLRGYKMSEVDWALARLSGEITELRNRVAELEGRPVTPGDAPDAERFAETADEPGDERGDRYRDERADESAERGAGQDGDGSAEGERAEQPSRSGREG